MARATQYNGASQIELENDREQNARAKERGCKREHKSERGNGIERGREGERVA